MVTDTDPSKAPPIASEGAPMASPQEPSVPASQEPGPGTEGDKGPVEEFWASLSPEARVEFARKLSEDELRQHPSFEETLKRHEQSERDRVRHEQEEADRRRQEQDTIARRRDDALKVLGENPTPEAARSYAEALTVAEYYPAMLDQDDDALPHTALWHDFTPEEQRAILVTARDWGDQRRTRYRALVAAVERVAAEATEKKFQGQRTGLEKAAEQLGYERGVRESRGEVPPRVGGAGMPSTGLTWERFNAMSVEERMKIPADERGRMYQEDLRRVRGR